MCRGLPLRYGVVRVAREAPRGSGLDRGRVPGAHWTPGTGAGSTGALARLSPLLTGRPHAALHKVIRTCLRMNVGVGSVGSTFHPVTG